MTREPVIGQDQPTLEQVSRLLVVGVDLVMDRLDACIDLPNSLVEKTNASLELNHWLFAGLVQFVGEIFDLRIDVFRI